MKILIFGATGRTGKIVAKEALKRNHKVNAVVRNKNKMDLSEVECFEGLPTDIEIVKKSLVGVDAIVCCLNIVRKSDFPWAKILSPPTLISDSINVIVKAMEELNVNRIVSMSTWGVGDTYNQVNIIFKLLLKYSNLWVTFSDHTKQEELLKQSNLNWTIVRPVLLNDNENSSYTVAEDRPLSKGISRSAVAKFIVDSIENSSFIKETPTIYQ